MATESQPDPEYVKALEEQIQRIERENRRLKREVLTLSPAKSTSKDKSPKPTRDWKASESSTVSVQLEDLEDIDLDEVLEAECEDSWIYRSPVKPSGDDSGLTPEQWLLQGLEGGSVTKNRDGLIDVRRDLSALLVAESTPHSNTGIVDNRGSSSASLDSSNDRLSLSGSGASTFTPLSVSPDPAHMRRPSPGSSPVLRPGSSTHTNFGQTPSPGSDSPGGDEPPTAAAVTSTSNNGSRRSMSSISAARPVQAKAASQRRSLGTPSSAGGGGGLAQPRAVPHAATAKAGAGSRPPMAGSRLSKPASSGGSSAVPAPAASGLRQPSSTSSKSRVSSGLPTASRPASQLPRPGQAQAAKSGLRAPRKVSGPSAGEPKGKDWSEGCY